jgi:hypothetical protein
MACVRAIPVSKTAKARQKRAALFLLQAQNEVGVAISDPQAWRACHLKLLVFTDTVYAQMHGELAQHYVLA